MHVAPTLNEEFTHPPPLKGTLSGSSQVIARDSMWINMNNVNHTKIKGVDNVLEESPTKHMTTQFL